MRPAPGQAVEPLLLDLPDRIETQRLVLRIPQAGDGGMLHEAVAETIVELRRYLGMLPWVAAEPAWGTFEMFCRKARAKFMLREDFAFLMTERGSGRLVGVCGLHRPDWHVRRVELGYWCRKSAQGHGFVVEGGQALCRYAFEELHAVRVEAFTDAENLASRRVAERCGMTFEGTMRATARWPDGSLRDVCAYARLPEGR